jgi:hypothetical protein
MLAMQSGRLSAQQRLQEGFMRHKSHVVSLMASLAIVAMLSPGTAQAQRRRPSVRRGVVVFVSGYFYDPFYGPYSWWPRAAWPYAYYPMFDGRAEVRLLVTPKDAAVYVDGYYAGVVDDFNGIFQRLPLPPGPHEIALYLNGYRTVHQRLYLAPNSDSTLRYTLERFAPGETAEPPFIAPPVPPPPPGTTTLPRTPYRGATPPPTPAPQVTAFGTLAIQVQPADAEVIIDGERWSGLDSAGRLQVHVAEGMHHIEIRKPGHRGFSTDVQVRPRETTPLNVSLSTETRE